MPGCTQFALDPTLRLIVPAEISVVSDSEAFPVSNVPEPRGAALMPIGTVALCGLARSGNSEDPNR